MSAISDEMLYPAQVADALKITPKTLEQWRWRGEGPRFFKLGRMVRYRRSDLEAWLSVRACTSAREGVALPRISESTPEN